MQRQLIEKLDIWKNNKKHKPLILQGARQTGKTYLLKLFSKTRYNQSHYFNFERNPELSSLFLENLAPKRIIEELSLFQEKKIDIENDLVIFDEIQSIPKALNSLKYFNEDLPELDVISAGSLLGLHLNQESFPVGKVDFLTLYPMNFFEFLQASAPEVIFEAYLQIKNELYKDNEIKIPLILHIKLLKFFSDYIFSGGMPEVVKLYVSTIGGEKLEQRQQIRGLQNSILLSYENDFAKHSGKINANHIISVFNNIPLQLSKTLDQSVKRFKFKDVISGKKSFAELEGPIHWLTRAGLIIKTGICNRIEEPLMAFTTQNIFKLYYFDLGLLSAQLSLPLSYEMTLDKGITKGYLAENFVAQELMINKRSKQINSWKERNSEIEFVSSNDTIGIFPIEVKSSSRVKAKSLVEYIKKYNPKRAYILSTRNYSKSKSITYLPIYLADIL